MGRDAFHRAYTLPGKGNRMDIWEKLEQYGVDVEGALTRVLGDKELYLECIQDFLEENSFNRLKEYMKAEHYQEAIAPAHALKGVTANLGLVPLNEKVVVLLETLRSGKTDHAQEQYEAFCKEMESFRKLLL